VCYPVIQPNGDYECLLFVWLNRVLDIMLVICHVLLFKFYVSRELWNSRNI